MISVGQETRNSLAGCPDSWVSYEIVFRQSLDLTQLGRDKILLAARDWRASCPISLRCLKSFPCRPSAGASLGFFTALRPLAWHHSAPKMSSKSRAGRSCVAFSHPASEVIQCYPCGILFKKAVTGAHHVSVGWDIDSIPWWGPDRVVENQWDGK